jgi:nicotinamide-nucleotide amidase
LPDSPLDVPALLALLQERGQTLAVAESLTGGAIASRLVEVPGASAVFRGAVVAYATDLKTSLLGVPGDLLRSRGPVDPDVAVAMADGARTRLSATYGIATTGVAGPAPQDGIDPGRVYVAVASAGDTHVQALNLSGDRASVRRQAADEALGLLARVILAAGSPAGEHPV